MVPIRTTKNSTAQSFRYIRIIYIFMGTVKDYFGSPFYNTISNPKSASRSAGTATAAP